MLNIKFNKTRKLITSYNHLGMDSDSLMNTVRNVVLWTTYEEHSQMSEY